MKKIFLLLLSISLWNFNSLQAQTQSEIEQMMKKNNAEKKDDEEKSKKKTNLSKEIKTRNKELNKKDKEESKKASVKAKETASVNKKEEEKKADKQKKASNIKEEKAAKTDLNTNIEETNFDSDLNKFGIKKLIKLGDKLAEKANNNNALAYYKAALFKAKKDKHKIAINNKLGETYYVLRNYKQAEKYYSTAVALNKKHKKYPLLEFQLANTYKYLAKYDTALYTYSKFLSLQEENKKVAKEKKRARIEKKGAAFGRDLIYNEEKFTIENIGENVNGAFADYGPEMSENKLFFSKIYTDNIKNVEETASEKKYSKIYYSEMYNDNFGYFQDFASSINKSKINVGNPSFTQNGNTVYFTECALDKNLQDNCRIMQSQRKNNEWQTAIALNSNINFENSSNTQPQIANTPTGEVFLLFVSNRTGSRGGKDIWISEVNENGDFKRAKRAKTPINTSYDEVSPFYHTASNTLYFSSNGHKSIGGFDVFKVENYLDSKEDLEVKNLGFPINSSVDDYDFILSNSEDLGFIVSNRQGNESLKNESFCDNIFTVKSTVVDLFVTGLVYAENNTSREIYTEADVYLYDNETNEKIEQITFNNKQAFFTQIEKDKEYKLVAISNNFKEETITFSTKNIKKSDTLQYDIFLKERNFIDYQIAKVYYKYGESKLREDASDTLRKVINFMNAYPNIIVEVGSHTDSKGSEEYNLKLGERRSLSVKNYLIYQAKINKKRLVNKSYGESKPTFPNNKPNGADNPSGRDKNRRTEFKVVGFLDLD